MRAALVMLALCACTSLDRLRAGTPDVTAPSGPGIYWSGQPAQPAAVPMVERIHRAIPCDAARSDWGNSVIHWEPDPFWCERWVHGCNPVRFVVQVARVDVLPDELGHAIWTDCYGRSGETTANGRTTYDPDFAAWLATVRSAP